MNAPPFGNRWLITGIFTTQSELHVGDGGAGFIGNRARAADKSKAGEEKESDASTVCVDHEGRAYVPGSGIKGALRDLVQSLIDKEEAAVKTWWKANENKRRDQREPKPAAPWSELLGSGKADSGGAVGGKLEFWDAFWTEGEGRDTEHYDPDRAHAKNDLNRPWWDKGRKTSVAVSVSLDRRTKTAKENLLYHLEYVPAGESFRFEIGGDNLSHEDIACLVVLLDRLDDGSATLGAQATNGWGRVAVSDLKICCLDRAGMLEWINLPTDRPKLPEISDKLMKEIEALTNDTGVKLAGPSDQLVIKLQVVMESPWLIRDPRQRERSKAAAKVPNLAEADKPTNAVPVRDEFGQAFAPAKSVRGALRARAEMILRTLELPCEAHPGDIKAVSTKGKDADVVLDDVRAKDLAARLFGFSGWMGPLHLTQLTQTNAPDDLFQEFVAIDRFTGGAAEGAKFNADLAGMTTLSGTLTVDLARLGRVDQNHASLGLLAEVLRDLAEGDIPLGSGSAKGQGFCIARAKIPNENGKSENLEEWFENESVVRALAAFRAGITTATSDHSDEAAA